MALRDQPYLPLFVQDFLTDEKLIECSAAAHGVYIKIMCLMHKSETYGKILLRVLPEDLPRQNDRQISEFAARFAEQLAKRLPFRDEEICRCLMELFREKVLYIEVGDEVFLCQKRMIKDNELSLKRSKSGKKGAETTNKIHQDFAAANHSANTENENEIKDSDSLEYLIGKLREIESVEIGEGEENLYAMIVLKMVEVFRNHNPDYFFHKETDYHAALKIAYHIAEMKHWKRDSVLNGNMDACVKSWEKIVQFVKADRWFATRSMTDLSTIKEWQRLVQSMKNVKHESSKPSPANTGTPAKSAGAVKLAGILRDELSTNTD